MVISIRELCGQGRDMDHQAESILRFKEEFPNNPSEAYKTCSTYDIVPTIAFVQGAAVYSLCASWGMRYVFTGGDDGFVRKYDFQTSLNGSQLLTVSQRHMLPDSITKAGVLSAYWENEQPLERDQYKVGPDNTYVPKLSPVYALAAQSEALWVCAGLESGGISLQSATYGEMGQCLAYLNGHSKAVSDLKLNSDERLLLSGSWDRSIGVWDMDAGVHIQKYTDLTGQVSCVDWQPMYARIEPYTEEQDDGDKSMESLFGSDDEQHDENGGTDGKPSTEDIIDSGGNDSNKEPVTKSDEEDLPDKDLNHRKDAEETGNIFLSSTFNGMVELWDKRQPNRISVLSGSNSPPWCMSACFSTDGSEVYAGRRNACVEGYDLRRCNEPSRTLKFPAISGAVSCVARMPNNRSILCASLDNIRVYDLKSERKTPFIIIPGHHGTVISHIVVDKSAKYMVSACGGRGWTENNSDVALAYEIEPEV